MSENASEAERNSSLNARIRDSAGWAISRSLSALSISYRLMDRNHQLLREQTLLFIDAERAGDILANRDSRLDPFLEETIRLLQNFLSSALSLVDHTRVFMQSYDQATDFVREYDMEKQERIVNSPVVGFVHNFRNYVIHCGLPPVVASLRIQNLPERQSVTTSIQIDREKILDWSGWREPARRYLSQIQSNIDLTLVIDEYMIVVRSFHEWFQFKQFEIHAEALTELRQLQDELRTRLEAQLPAGTEG